MKATGIIRRIDKLGRIVLAKELRDKYGWKEGTPLEVYTDNGRIILAEYKPGCHCCGAVVDNMVEVLDLRLCPVCVDRVKAAGA